MHSSRKLRSRLKKSRKLKRNWSLLVNNFNDQNKKSDKYYDYIYGYKSPRSIDFNNFIKNKQHLNEKQVEIDFIKKLTNVEQNQVYNLLIKNKKR